MKAPTEVAESGPAVVKAFALENFVGEEAIKSNIHSELIGVSFSAGLSEFYSPISELCRKTLEEMLGNGKTYENLLIDFSYPLVCKLTTRSVLGPDFEQNVELQKLFIDYNRVAEKMMGIGLLLPKIFHSFFTVEVREQDAKVRKIITPVLQKRRSYSEVESPEKPHNIDLLQKMIDKGLTDDQILDTIKTIMWAAVMNTSSATVHVLYDIFSDPVLVQKISDEQSEIRESPDGLNYESFEKMTFLDACIKETLRIAAAPFGAVRETYQPVRFGESRTVPANVIVAIARHSLHHDEKYWEKPEEYDPRRFLENKVKNWTYVPFGGGRSTCPGRYYAVFVMKVIVSELMRSYKVSVPGKRPGMTVNGNEVRRVKAKIDFIKKVK